MRLPASRAPREDVDLEAKAVEAAADAGGEIGTTLPACPVGSEPLRDGLRSASFPPSHSSRRRRAKNRNSTSSNVKQTDFPVRLTTSRNG